MLLAHFIGKPTSEIKRAGETLEWLATFAEAGRSIEYGQLSKLVGNVDPHTVLPKILGGIGKSLQTLDSDIPSIQLLVVGKKDKIPGHSGLRGFLIKNEAQLQSLSLEDKRHRWEEEEQRIFAWDWRSVLDKFGLSPVSVDEEEKAAIATFGYEGRIRLQLHRSRERLPQLVKAKKEEALAKFGKLQCEVCEFVYTAYYGDHGSGFVECHHRQPLSNAPDAGIKVTMDDLALVCANCHRMLHWKSGLSVEELRSRIQLAHG